MTKAFDSPTIAPDCESVRIGLNRWIEVFRICVFASPLYAIWHPFVHSHPVLEGIGGTSSFIILWLLTPIIPAPGWSVTMSAKSRDAGHFYFANPGLTLCFVKSG